jgi:hypothetical protein
MFVCSHHSSFRRALYTNDDYRGIVGEPILLRLARQLIRDLLRGHLLVPHLSRRSCIALRSRAFAHAVSREHQQASPGEVALNSMCLVRDQVAGDGAFFLGEIVSNYRRRGDPAGGRLFVVHVAEGAGHVERSWKKC